MGFVIFKFLIPRSSTTGLHNQPEQRQHLSLTYYKSYTFSTKSLIKEPNFTLTMVKVNIEGYRIKN